MLYRAIPRAGFSPAKQYPRLPSSRVPKQVSLLVDNVWEYLRPPGSPSRRHSAFASPSPELALANASAVGNDPAAYLVCEVDVRGDFCVAQMNVTDARYHHDTRRIPDAVLSHLGADFSGLPLDLRAKVAPLFMPYISRADLQVLAERSGVIRSCVEVAASVSTMWADTNDTVAPDSPGEMFFELTSPGGYYMLTPV